MLGRLGLVKSGYASFRRSVAGSCVTVRGCSVVFLSTTSKIHSWDNRSQFVRQGLGLGVGCRKQLRHARLSFLLLGQFVQMVSRLHGHTSIGNLSVDFGQCQVNLLVSGFRAFSLLQRPRRLLAEILLLILGPCNLLNQLDTFPTKGLDFGRW